jgi:hypothetical protein
MAAIGLLALAATSGCSSSSPAPANSGPACNPCDDAGSTIATPTSGHDANPDGVPYPSSAAGYGHTPRAGAHPGSIIENFKFLGYPNADKSQGLQTISLADYYDPCNKRFKVLHLSVAGVWCVPCNEETSALVAAKTTLDAEHVVLLQALDDGPTMGVPATLSDLNYWVADHTLNFTEMLDPGLHNLGGFFDAAAIPWNADIDPRTMELLDSTVGFSDVASELAPALAEVAQPADYPVAGTCP